MTTATFILLIILSTALFIMIILGIVAVAFAITILRQIRRITSRAEATTESVSDIVAAVGKRVGPVAVSTVAAAILRRFKKSKKEK